MRVSPLTIKIMLACYTSPDPEEEIGSHIWNSESGASARNWLKSDALIDLNHRPSGKGEAWVEFICDTPIPVLRYQLPEREA